MLYFIVILRKTEADSHGADGSSSVPTRVYRAGILQKWLRNQGSMGYLMGKAYRCGNVPWKMTPDRMAEKKIACTLITPGLRVSAFRYRG
jgi:hypothetical protein